MIDLVGAIIGSLGLISLVFAQVILGQFGRKLGAVTKMRAYYQAYYVAGALLTLALVIRFLRASIFWAPESDIAPALNSPLLYLFLYHLPLAAGLTIGLVVTWLYWSWLLKE
ncbi:MAG: hypothetical protein JXA93_15160 [Anaerolineae bacterium]|nr:hypothetical protein [Anaerolineae bacterium]